MPHIPRSAVLRNVALFRISKWARPTLTFISLVLAVPLAAHAPSGGSPFDTGFTAIQTLFTGTIAKVASLVAIVIGGYGFAHGEPGAKNFDHGYAVTSHSSQGLTADRVLVNVDTSTHPQLLNSRFAYVSVSRASLDATIYTNNTASLGADLSREVGKSAAMDVSQSIGHTTVDLSQGIGF